MGGGMIFFSARTQKLVDFDLPTTTTLKAPVIHTDNPFSILLGLPQIKLLTI